VPTASNGKCSRSSASVRSGALFLLIFVIAAWSTGCLVLRPHSPFELAEGLSARVLRTPQADVERGMARRGDAGYNLYLLTVSIGLDVAAGRIHLRAPEEGGNRQKLTITGHSWLVLESPQQRIECGHTARERGWLGGVQRLSRQGDPNPISFLWKDLRIGQRHGRAFFVRPTFVLCLRLTVGQHADISKFIATYDFLKFNVIGHECTDFVAGAARLAGVEVDYNMSVAIPPTIRLFGRTYRMWTTGSYSELVIACPDVLEACLRRLAKQNVGEDVTASWTTGRRRGVTVVDAGPGGSARNPLICPIEAK
jgi:hypothetical protein